MSSTEEKLNGIIPAEFHIFSGCHGGKISTETVKANKVRRSRLKLPNSAGRTGGVYTGPLLRVLYCQSESGQSMSWAECLWKMRTELQQNGNDEVPQLTSSRWMDVNAPMYICPPDSGDGRKRAILIGINYAGQEGALTSCHHDAQNMKQYLMDVQGFPERDILMLLDDGRTRGPTRRNIEDACAKVCQASQDGDTVWVHYSGHGGQVRRNKSRHVGKEHSSLLFPADFCKSGQISEDDVFKMLVQPMKKGVVVTVFIDSCHSGTTLDLPYRFSAGEREIRLDSAHLHHMLGVFGAGALLCCAFVETILWLHM